MNRIKSNLDTIIHMNMAFVGGFFGGYAILLRGGTFASAQTANMIELVLKLVEGDFSTVLLHIGILAIYIVMTALAAQLPHLLGHDCRRICIIFEMIGVIGVGLIPLSVNHLLAIYPIFAMAAFQWGNFAGAKGYASSTIFSTNNLKQTVVSFTEYIRTGDRKMKDKAAFFGCTIISFHTGVAVSAVLSLIFSFHAAWFCLMPLTSAFILVTAANRQEAKIASAAAVIS